MPSLEKKNYLHSLRNLYFSDEYFMNEYTVKNVILIVLIMDDDDLFCSIERIETFIILIFQTTVSIYHEHM